MYIFEFDDEKSIANKDEKSIANKDKHGIDFLEAQTLWADEWLIEFFLTDTPELRHGVIGQMNEKCWTAIITYRGNNIRLISVRRSRKGEQNAYEEQKETYYE